MSSLPIPLHADESLLKTDENAARVKNKALALMYNVIYGNLWLTTHRLIFESSPPGSLTSYPLSHIRNARSTEVKVSQRQPEGSVRNYDAALHIEFDNGGKEYFIPRDVDEWVAAISDARVEAPELPFTQKPPNRSALEQDRRRTLSIGAAVLTIILFFICIYLAFIWVPIVVSLFG